MIEILTKIFVLMYPLVIGITTVGYLPQIKTLIFTKKKPYDISLQSWVIWTIGSFLTFGYGLLHLKDFMFNLWAGLSFMMIGITMLLIIYNRYFRFKDE